MSKKKTLAIQVSRNDSGKDFCILMSNGGQKLTVFGLIGLHASIH